MKFERSYLIKIEFLGFRYHGWQKQKKVKTVHQMIDKTLLFALGHKDFKSHGIGRTDSKVSASSYYFQLFVNDVLKETDFIAVFNSNLPADINGLTLKEVSLAFNIIKQQKIKEYLYFFTSGQKNHPFCAPFMVAIDKPLNLDLMKLGAKLFEGDHYFHKYCTKPSKNTEFYREIKTCEIEENKVYTANFFPDKSYLLRVRGSGFLRYQVRLMMAVLFELGRGEVNLDFIEQSLVENNDRQPLKQIAPASGLQLYSIEILD